MKTSRLLLALAALAASLVICACDDGEPADDSTAPSASADVAPLPPPSQISSAKADASAPTDDAIDRRLDQLLVKSLRRRHGVHVADAYTAKN